MFEKFHQWILKLCVRKRNWKVNRVENTSFKLTLKKGKEDLRDQIYTRHLTASPLPDKYVIPSLPPVRNQGNIGSCCSHAAIGAYEIELLMQKPHKFLEGSELYHYFNVRHYINGEGDRDEGQTIRDGCKCLDKYHMATEYACPYDVSKFNVKPSWVSYLTSGAYKITQYEQLLDLDAIKHAVTQNIPVLFGTECFESLFKLNLVNYIYIPSGNNVGGHALLVVGYDNQKEVFIIRNSWGSRWGNGGYFEYPYAEFEKHTFDWWVIHIK